MSYLSVHRVLKIRATFYVITAANVNQFS